MSNKTYKIIISTLSVLMVAVLVIGIITTVILGGTNKFKKIKTSLTPSKTEVAAVTQEHIVKTDFPEDCGTVFFTLSKLTNKYPLILKQGVLGKTEKGRDIPMVLLGTGQNKALIIAGIHSREHITVKYMLKVIEDYCSAYYSQIGALGSYNIKELLNKYTLYIVPCANPDGLQVVRSLDKVKNGVKVSDLSEYKANYNGVDLNRNFPIAWDKIDNGIVRPSQGFFKGYKSGSEKETKALMNICEKESFDFLFSFHVKGNCIFWGDTYDTSNNQRFKAFAQDVATASGFRMTQPTLSPTNYGGGFENWFRHKYKKPGFCIELTDIKYTVKPLGNNNYKNFNSFTNYEYSRFALASAMASNNK